MSEWVYYSGPTSGSNEHGVVPSYGAKKWFGDHYKEVVAASQDELSNAIIDLENEVEVKAEGAEQDFEEIVQGLRDQADLLENPPVSEPSPTQEDISATATVVLSPAEVVAAAEAEAESSTEAPVEAPVETSTEDSSTEISAEVVAEETPTENTEDVPVVSDEPV